MSEAWDALVVGAGPAGMAAAVSAAESGLRVLLLDAARQPGGQYWRHPDEAAQTAYAAHLTQKAVTGPTKFGGSSEGFPRKRGKPTAGDRLRGRLEVARGRGGLTYRPNAQVWFVEGVGEGFELRVAGAVGATNGPGRVRTRAVILCPGGYDRQLPVPGWDLPGVMAAGGVQALLKAQQIVAGRRVVVAGTGPFLLPVAAGLAEAGADVVAVCEAGSPRSWLPHLPSVARLPSKVTEGLSYARALAQHRIPYRTRTVVTQILGTDDVRGVRTERITADGTVHPGRGAELAVDLVALGWGFTPSLELVTALGAATRIDLDGSLVACVDTDQRTDVPGVYVAGEATGVGGAVLAQAEGELAGLAAARAGGRAVSDHRAARLRATIRRHRAFAAAMHRAHPVPARWSTWLTADTTVCRCEEVSYGEVCAARDELGARDTRTVKLLARPGMGWCQGKVCGFAVAHLAGGGGPLQADDLRSGAKRSLAAPITLQTLAEAEPRPGGERG
jgi:thioredoxin reductase